MSSMSKRQLASAVALVAATMGLATSAQAAVKTYTGADGSAWDTAASWSLSSKPSGSTDNVVISGTAANVTSTMNIASPSPFVLTGLGVGYQPASVTGANIVTHTIDLNNKTLSVAGTLGVGRVANNNTSFTGNLTLQNGTVSLSSGALEVGLKFGTGTSSATGTLTGTSTLAFSSSALTRFWVGVNTHSSQSGVGTMNFAAVNGGTLSAAGGADLLASTGTNDNNASSIRIGVATGNNTNSGSVSLGNNWTTTFGTSTSARTDILIGVRSSGAPLGSFVQAGGTFTAYANNFDVGVARSSGAAVGTLNLGGLDSISIDTNTFSTGVIGTSQGTVSLAAGNVTINTAATVGGGTKGTLNLNRTKVSVGSAATLALGTTGEINSTIGSVSGGIDIANPAVGAMAINASSQVSNTRGLEITFEANPTGVNYQASATVGGGIFYGFKWAGNQVVNLTGILNGTDNIVGNADDLIKYYQTGLTGEFANKATIFYDGTGAGTLNTDATYIGFYTSSIPEPAMLGLFGGVAGLMMLRRRQK